MIKCSAWTFNMAGPILLLTDYWSACRFALPHKDQPIGLPIGQHISLKAIKPAADGTEIFKPYTPISDDDLLGYVDFVIKVFVLPAQQLACILC